MAGILIDKIIVPIVHFPDAIFCFGFPWFFSIPLIAKATNLFASWTLAQIALAWVLRQPQVIVIPK